MRLAAILAMAAGAAILTGCGPVVSVQPLYTEQDLVYDLPLEGTWAAQDDGEIWQVQRSGDGYRFESSADKFIVHLLHVNGLRFLDITSPAESALAVSGHVFAKVWMEDGALRISLMNDTWVEKIVQQGLGPQSVTNSEREVVLTAPTNELQRFVWLYAADPEAFETDAGEWRRVP